MKKLLLALIVSGMTAWSLAGQLSPTEERVRKELASMPYYSVFDNLTFQVDGGKVILDGVVVRPTLKKRAERVVLRLEEVSEVENRIRVLPVSSLDQELRRNTYYSIYGHPNFTRYAFRAVPPIHIIVENGDITLEGVVASEADKNFAGILARGVANSFSVTNNLRVQKDDDS